MDERTSVTVTPAPWPGRRKLLLWLGLGVFCAIFAVGERAVEWSRRRAVWEDVEHRRKYYELVSMVGNYIGQSPDYIEKKLNGGNPLVVIDPDRLAYGREIPGGAINSRYDAWHIRVKFKGDKAYGFHIVPPPHTRYTGPSANWIQMERFRSGLLIFAAGAWCIAAMALPFAGRWRRNFAQACLAAVLVAGLAWSLHPSRVWSRAELIAPMPIAIGAGALISLIALILPVRRPDPNRIHCDGCGYNLTGNESGICPECGRPTPKSRIERWRDEASRIEEVTEIQNDEVDPTGPVSSSTTIPPDPADPVCSAS